MKILFDNQIFFRQRFGGISKYYSRLTEELLLTNHQVKLFAGIHMNAYLDEIPQSSVVGKMLVKYPSRSVGIINRLNKVWGTAYQKFYKADLVHETYFSAQSPIQSKSLKVVGVYDMIQEIYPELFPKAHLTTETKKKALDRADHIISISHQTKKDLCNLFDIPEEKVSVVHLAADQAQKNLDLVNLELQRPFMLYVGDRAGYKNFQLLVQAFAASKILSTDFDLIVFGGQKFSQEELSLFQQSGLKENQVKYFSGHDSILGKLYSKAAAFVYPSLYEGFGIPPLEAMAYGCPVLCSNTSSLPEVVGDAALTFDPLDREEMMHCMEQIAFNSEMRAQMIAKGNQRSREFSWKKTAQQTMKVYETLV